MTVERPLKKPRTVENKIPVLDKGRIGKTFKKEAKAVQDALASLSLEDINTMEKKLNDDGYMQIKGINICII